MSIRPIIKRIIPTPIRKAGWGVYYSLRRQTLRTVVGAQTSEKIIALTFDDGPNPAGTPVILDMLARHHANATFFMLGKNVDAHPELAQQVIQEGHAIGNHTYDHLRLVGQSYTSVRRDLQACQNAIWRATGTRPKIMRPPYGDQDTVAYLATQSLGFKTVRWNISGDDWKGDPADQVLERIKAELVPGGIVLLHDGWETPPSAPDDQADYSAVRDRHPTVQALEQLLEGLYAEGYRFVTVPQLLSAGKAIMEEWLL